MRSLFTFLLVVSVGFLALAQEEVRFTEDGFLLIDGNPSFVLGLYELPKDDAVLQQAAAHGFNIFRADTDPQTLDRLAAHDVYGWVPLRGRLKLREGDAVGRQNLIDTVTLLKDHPALLCWEGPDEALWMAYFAGYGWLMQEQPKLLMERIAKAAADGNPEAATYGVMLEKAADYTQRCLWPEAEALYNAIWDGLGEGNLRPELMPEARIAAARELGDALTRGWECVWELDNTHLFWQNHAPCNSLEDLRYHNRAVHAAGCDIYPAPDNMGVVHGQALRDIGITGVGDATTYMRQGAPGKACWMVLQGFGWTDLKEQFNPHDPVHGRRPDFKESRFMAYDTLLHGANAILYWGTYAIEKDSQLWQDLMRLGKELRALEPAIVGTQPPMKPMVLPETNFTTFNGGDPKLMLRQAGEDWVLIAVNEFRFGVAFQVQGLPQSLNGKTLYRLYSDEEHQMEAGGFRDGIQGHDVHVYATSRRFEAK